MLTSRRWSRSLRTVSARVPLSDIVVRPAGLLRMFCALAVAIVTTFHVCGFAAARDAGPALVVYQASDHAQTGDVEMTAEKCHMCAVASLPATLTFASAHNVLHSVPAGASSDLLPFWPSATSPPPRT